ncbi:MFS transporter [Streptomyces sp. NPDC006553]|uniref:MFS transporter n=1 Tax=unclassified Streptomyces TaxID=2593676 RepID=UPI00224E1D8D|nr:MFS transporter [Streptomyces sp. NBC_00233]MCX5228276.1 MFS transporter [Streptomyces sp. NBC_00233]
MVALDHPKPVEQPAAPAAGPTDARMTGRMRLVLVVLLLAQFMLAVDFSILNVALPVIGQGLGFSLGGLQWIATAFALAAAGFTLLFGRVADLVGRRRLFLGGMALLGVSSLVGGLATGPEMLMAARVAQGLATAAVTPAGLSLLTASFPEGPLRARALGLNGALMSAGFTTGAILGGVLTDLLSWRWAFLVNVPVALAVLLVAPAVLTESRPAVRPRLDVPGAITVTGGLLALVYGLTVSGEHGWTDPTALIALAAGAALLVAFVLVERRAAAPLVPIHILKRRTVVWGNLAGLVAFVTETSLVFLMTLYLQDVLDFSPLAAGLSFGVLGAGTVLGGVFASRFIGRFGARTALVSGGLLQAVATLSLYGLGEGPGSLWLLLAATFAGGIGNMLAIVGFMVTATSGIPDHEQGTATGLATMTQQIGITMGTPIMSAVVVTAPVLLDGIGLAVLVNAAIVAAGAVLAGLFLRRT